MADESRYSDPSITGSGNKRKYDDQGPPSRRPTGFSSPDPANMPPSYNNVPPPANDIQAAKQRAQEIAARLLSGASAGAAAADIKRPRVDNGGSGFDSFENKGFSSGPPDSKFNSAPSSIPASYGSYLGGSSKKIDIPNGRVGVIIGKGGETIKYLQNQSGAKIQITRDMDADLSAPTRTVELMGSPDQVAKAEELINDVLAEAEAGSSGTVSRRFVGGQGASEHFSMKIPNNKVGLVIGKGGETIKNIQARTGARVQVIPLHLPPGDTSTERTVHIDGTVDQIEAAKQLVYEVTNENRGRNPMSGGYSQQGYQNRQSSNWGPPDASSMQQPGYGYMQPGSYPPPSSQYNMSQPPYSGYGQPTSGGYSSGWDQSSAPTDQQKGQGYDYYNQPPSQQPPATGAPPAPVYNAGYNYGQPPAYGQQGQGYAQGGYGGYYQSGYGQASQYDQQQGYNSASGYGNVASAGQEGKTPPSYGAQGDSTQGPPPPSTGGQQGYGTGQQPGANLSSYSTAPTSQPGYGVPPTSQAAYGSQTQTQPGYGPTLAQKPPANPPVYGQSQQSPSTPGGYGQAAPTQPGYPYSQQPQSGYAPPESGLQRTPPPSYGAPAAQPGYGPPYGAPPAGQSAYGGQGPPAYNTSYGSYSQPPAYPVDGNSSGNGARGTYDAVPPASQTAQQTVAKASPKS